MPRGQPKKNIIPEAQEQEALFQWADFSVGKYPELALLYHVPNEGRRSKTNGAALKRQGLKSGIPDICLPVARGRFHGAYIEMKCIGGKPTKEQKEWLGKLSRQGYACYIADKGWQDAVAFLTWYLNLTPELAKEES